MIRVTFIHPDGTRENVQVAEGTSVMEAARANDVSGIIADCGGHAACATCHVYVAPPWAERVSPPSSQELEMVQEALDPRPSSRLSCQIRLTKDLDGLEVELPERQL